jgi:hypothetical protein
MSSQKYLWPSWVFTDHLSTNQNREFWKAIHGLVLRFHKVYSSCKTFETFTTVIECGIMSQQKLNIDHILHFALYFISFSTVRPHFLCSSFSGDVVKMQGTHEYQILPVNVSLRQTNNNNRLSQASKCRCMRLTNECPQTTTLVRVCQSQVKIN